jgi:hypothetical protein
MKFIFCVSIFIASYSCYAQSNQQQYSVDEVKEITILAQSLEGTYKIISEKREFVSFPLSFYNEISKRRKENDDVVWQYSPEVKIIIFSEKNITKKAENTIHPVKQ